VTLEEIVKERRQEIMKRRKAGNLPGTSEVIQRPKELSGLHP